MKNKSGLTIRLSLDHPTGNFWVDTGLIVLVQQFGEGEHSADKVLNWIQNQLLRSSGNRGKYYDENTGEVREYAKVNWVYPTNLFIKVAGRASKVTVEVDGEQARLFTAPPRFELNLKLGKQLHICDLCGETARLTDAKMWMYPFLVEPSKFGTFYPGTTRRLGLCARCALAGLAAYRGWLWKAQGREALHFFIFHSDLREMLRLHQRVLSPLSIEGGKGGTARVAFSGPYVNETLLGLLLELFRYVREPGPLPKEAQQVLAEILGAAEAPPVPITLYAISGTPGQAFQMKAFREFSKLQRLFQLYERWIALLAESRVDNPHNHVARIFEQFWSQRGQSRETIWRERIAQRILEFGDPMPWVEQFLYDARAREQNPRPLVYSSLEVLNHFLQEVLAMDEQLLKILGGFGSTLGSAAHEHNEMGLLYALRNAKNPDDFYRVLNDGQFRLQITVPEALLRIEKGERIAGSPWVRVKTLLSIYAMNSYLRRNRADGGTAAGAEGSTSS